MINQFGGRMESAVGIPEEQLRRAAQSAVCKIKMVKHKNEKVLGSAGKA